MKTGVTELEEKGKAAKAASRKLAFLPTEIKNKALLGIADALKAKQNEILSANSQDYKEAEASGMSAVMLDRLPDLLSYV
jgi:glutamate-5-semialdehyde dehydrogenase